MPILLSTAKTALTLMKLLPLLGLLFTMSINAETLSTPDYKIEYDESWDVLENEEPPGYSFLSNELEVKITTSSLRFPDGKNINQLSQHWLNLRIESEDKLMNDAERKLEAQSNLKEIPIGYQAEYWGTDSEKRHFRFWCVISKNKIVNVYIESYKQTPDEMENILRHFLKSLRI